MPLLKPKYACKPKHIGCVSPTITLFGKVLNQLSTSNKVVPDTDNDSSALGEIKNSPDRQCLSSSDCAICTQTDLWWASEGAGGNPALLVVMLLWVVVVLMMSSFSFRPVESALRSRLDAWFALAGRQARAGPEAACGAEPKASTERVRITAQRTLAWWLDCAMRRREADRRADSTCLGRQGKDGTRQRFSHNSITTALEA